MSDVSGRDAVINALSQTKAGQTVAAATSGLGLGVVLEVIPSLLGASAAFVGIVLSVFLIKKARAETRKIELEEQILRNREEERIKNVQP